MKKSKLFILALAAPMLLTGITSCQQTTHKMKHEEFKESPQDLKYLYEVTYNDYSWDDVTKWMNSSTENNDGAGFGCSSIHYGNYYGRSFDFCLTDMCEFLVRTKHENGHYASLGMAIADCHLNKEKVNKIISGEGMTEKEILNEKMLPFTMVDGINEKGVVCNTNVVPAKDLIPHEDDEDGKYHTHGTNSGKPDLFYQFMPRFILDNAKSAKHAVELLKNRNLTAINKKGKYRDYLGVSHMGYELHCMVADKDDTFIIEMVDDRMNVLKSGANVMTNYYLSNTTPSGAGLERYGTLFDHLQKWKAVGATYNIESMKTAIQDVQYSLSYDPNWETDAICAKWPTEFAGCSIIKEDGSEEKLTFYNAADWCTDNWTKEGVNLKEQLDGVYKSKITPYLDDINKPRESRTGGDVPWISTHAEVFDIEKRELHLVTQEQNKGETPTYGKKDPYDFKEFKL